MRFMSGQKTCTEMLDFPYLPEKEAVPPALDQQMVMIPSRSSAFFQVLPLRLVQLKSSDVHFPPRRN